jgi:hypothetical protein
MGKNSAYITGWEIEYGRFFRKPRRISIYSIQIRIQSNNCSIVLIMLLWQDLGSCPYDIDIQMDNEPIITKQVMK